MEVEFIGKLKFEKKNLSDQEKKDRHRIACKKYYEKNRELIKEKNLRNYYEKKRINKIEYENTLK